MSGTSADGVDVALVQARGRGAEMTASLVRAGHRAYDPTLRRAILDLRSGGSISLAELGRLGREISLTYAAACNELLSAAGVEAAEVAAIAAHGQTLFHDPPTTIQWFDPALLAAETGCAAVSDFRRADCAAGGQGAPLVPFADYVLFRDPEKNRVLLNIGGIANLTFIPAGAPIDRMIAFDTGPGNCISDFLVRRMNPAGEGIDADGAIAERGLPIGPVVQRFLADGYFSRALPKSTDGPAMIELFERSVAAVRRHDPPENLLRTACALTADSILLGMRQFLPERVDEVIASGGGVRNATIMRLLRQRVGPIPLKTTDELGMPGEAKEAVAFALLGAATLDGEPSNVPAVTGAKRKVVLGSITPRP